MERFGKLTLAAILMLVLPENLRAAGNEDARKKSCASSVANPITTDNPNYEIVYSGRNAPIDAELREAAEILFGKNGVSKHLGLAFPAHVVEFAPSAELSALSSLGRHAVPHWHDGSQLAQAAKLGGNVLEFVTPGCPTCRSFYSDTTKLEHQISVLMHVVGHNDFAAHSMYCISRPCDPISESLSLAETMEKLYQEYDHDEVSQWYQYLLSASTLQDLTRGTFEFPETFAASQAQGPRIGLVAKDLQNGYSGRKRPAAATPSVLQAMVANLPPGAPEWKRKMAAHFEKIYRVYGFYSSNKIMNEGWATLMQELLPPYTRYATSHHAIEFGDLLRGVAGHADLSNPYWLGRQCWRRIRVRFNQRPEIKPLTPLEKDRRFIQYAHDDIISVMNDYDFLLYALDEQWVHDFNLYLNRPASRDEVDPSLPRPKEPDMEQKIVLSRDPKRIIQWIARKVADKRLRYPQILLDDIAGPTVRMVHDAVDGIPLDRKSAAQTLYVLSQALEKPVSLLTIQVPFWEKKKASRPDEHGWSFMAGQWDRPGPRRNLDDFRPAPIRIEVHPAGKVTVVNYDLASKAETPIVGLTALMQEAVDFYRLDQQGTDNAALLENQRESFLAPSFVSEVNDGIIRQGSGLLTHSPTSGHALLEFGNLVGRRLQRALELARAGKLAFRKGKRGVRLQVLPLVPEFRLDNKVVEAREEHLPPAPVDGGTVLRELPPALFRMADYLPVSYMPEPDDSSGLGEGDGKVGDKRWGKKKQKQQGSGEDGDDEEEGEDGDEPNKGNDSGSPQDPSEIEIPHDLFASFMFQNFKLPNLTRRSGDSEIVEHIRDGGVHKPQGNVLWDRTIPVALTYAVEVRRRKGLPYRNIPQHILLREGMRYIQPSDYVVSDRVEIPTPDMKALIVYVIDLTGSMYGRPQELAKEWVGYVDWLVAKNYKGVESRFVGYDDVAYEFPREKIFKTFLGGGNTDSEGFKLAEKILADPKYRGGDYDLYVFGIGDGGSFDGPETHAALERLRQRCQYTGFVQVSAGWGGVADFIQPMRDLSLKEPWVGFAELIDDGGMSVFSSIHDFFKQTGAGGAH